MKTVLQKFILAVSSLNPSIDTWRRAIPCSINARRLSVEKCSGQGGAEKQALRLAWSGDGQQHHDVSRCGGSQGLHQTTPRSPFRRCPSCNSYLLTSCSCTSIQSKGLHRHERIISLYSCTPLYFASSHYHRYQRSRLR
ncbi:hypothetical protein E2C01_033454 [Portunus trituberculatus]|uniref:Uncharacterized protein n=1 Tax=Portunus trituberculatus TaxID=210409 RepID=A0A5B7F063_PORTR|nr:hypothetical protein [Portunus trituberculatus]